MEHLSIVHVFYDTHKSLEKNLLALGRYYALKDVVRRVRRFINKQNKGVANICAFEVYEYEYADRCKVFRVYFDEFVVETLADYILHGNKNL